MPLAVDIQKLTAPDVRTLDMSSVERLEAFYKKLVEKGLVRKPGYSLPLPDTIGRNSALRRTDRSL